MRAGPMAVMSAKEFKPEAVLFEPCASHTNSCFKNRSFHGRRGGPKDANLHAYRCQGHTINPIIPTIVQLRHICCDSKECHGDEGQRDGERSHAELDRPSPIMLAQCSASL